MWIFLTIVLVVIGVWLIYHSWPTESFEGVIGVILCFIALTIPIIRTFPKQCNPTANPTALDVYRGNTELKITSVNGIPTDSTVVFKNK
jgi:hypothetical protein